MQKLMANFLCWTLLIALPVSSTQANEKNTKVSDLAVPTCPQVLSECDKALSAADALINKQREGLKNKDAVIQAKEKELRSSSPLLHPAVWVIVGAAVGGFVVYKLKE